MLFYFWCFNIHLFVSIFIIFMEKWLKLRAQRNVSHTTGYLNCLMLIYLIPMEIGKDDGKGVSLTSAVDFNALLFKFISTSFCGWLSDNYTFINKVNFRCNTTLDLHSSTHVVNLKWNISDAIVTNAFSVNKAKIMSKWQPRHKCIILLWIEK